MNLSFYPLECAAPADRPGGGPIDGAASTRSAPYGTWSSPIDATAVASGGLRFGGIVSDGEDLYWVEGRPSEGGRNVVVKCDAGGRIADVTPPGTNVRTRVHEYGGGAFAVHGGIVYYSEFTDQRLYRLRPGALPEPLTPTGRWFYGDYVVDPPREQLVCVREDHTSSDGEVVNTLVSIPLAGGAGAGRILARGYDFYSTPRLSADGASLAWLSWRHPNMPWDGTELWTAGVGEDGTLVNPTKVAGGPSESVFQPGWSPDGELYYVSDRSGWWNLYRARAGTVEPVHSMEAEFGRPQWGLGMSTWAFVGPTLIVAAYTRGGRWRLSTIDTRTGTFREVTTDIEPQEWIAATASSAVFVGASPTRPAAVVRLDLRTGRSETIRAASAAHLDPGYLSTAEPIEFPTGGGLTAHAFYYPPWNRDYAAPAWEKPPLIVISHGGPTGATTPALDLRVQYWTSRGFAVVDVNYGGSTGYGRAYRERLNGQWGVVDVADCVNAARHLVARGLADGSRLIIRGGSAGGYTTLAALTFHPGVFAAGASYYGISDLEALGRDSHKFESRYSDSLIGPYPAARDVYRARSPIHFADRLSCPLILFQGLEDKVVPPNQSEMMADALRTRGLPVAYLTFEGEQHGFRKGETIVASLEAELYFYGAVFGFAPAGQLPPVGIENLERWRART
jgi:dipeptidyl aminopeptidase/acylaminoacyl peptidase